jgi:hypothetical protein
MRAPLRWTTKGDEGRLTRPGGSGEYRKRALCLLGGAQHVEPRSEMIARQRLVQRIGALQRGLGQRDDLIEGRAGADIAVSRATGFRPSRDGRAIA